MDMMARALSVQAAAAVANAEECARLSAVIEELEARLSVVRSLHFEVCDESPSGYRVSHCSECYSDDPFLTPPEWPCVTRAAVDGLS